MIVKRKKASYVQLQFSRKLIKYNISCCCCTELALNRYLDVSLRSDLYIIFQILQ